MFARILVPLDGSARAEQAIPEAARLARATQGTIILVQAVAPPPQYPATYVPVEPLPYTAYESLQEEAKVYLARVAHTDLLSGIRVESYASVGSAALQILEVATAHSADLIVMSSHGRTGLARWVLGSVAQHIVRHADVPVLVVRQHETPMERATTEAAGTATRPVPSSAAAPPAAGTTPVRILVPLDGSQVAEAVLEPAAAIALALAAPSTQDAGASSATIHLMLVVSPYYAVPDNQPFTLLMDGAKAYLAHTADRLSAAHPRLTVTWRVAVAGDAALTIVRVAEHGEDAAGPHGESLEGVGTTSGGASTMIAIATHGRTGFERWAMGSIAERVVGTTSLPLLVVRPRIGNVHSETSEQSMINE